MSNYRPKMSRFGAAQPYRSARLDRPSYCWSQRDWAVFRASCSSTPRQRARAVEVVTWYRSGVPVSEIAVAGQTSRQYVYVVLLAEDLRDAHHMAVFYRGRRNLGRPIDLGGLRDEWVECDVIDEQDDEHAAGF
jgi:hypothetical protein